MSRARIRELVVLFAVGSALTLAVFFLALWLLPFETFTPFPFPRFPALFNSSHSSHGITTTAGNHRGLPSFAHPACRYRRAVPCRGRPGARPSFVSVGAAE